MVFRRSLKVFLCSSRASLQFRALIRREKSLAVYNGGAGFFPRDPLEGRDSYLTVAILDVSPYKPSFVYERQLGLHVCSAQLVSGLDELMPDISLRSVNNDLLQSCKQVMNNRDYFRFYCTV